LPPARCDLAVVGAGPAGAAAASAALRAGLGSVVLLDRAAFPRDKPCGGALTHHAFSGLEAAGLTLRVAAVRPVEAAVTGGGRRQSADLLGSCAVVRRLEFDADLVAQVRDAGARVVEHFAVDAMEGGPPEIHLRAGDRQITARAVIFCGGVGGIGRRLLGLSAGRRAQLRQVDVARASGATSELRFDLDDRGAGLRGYYWEFPSQLEGRPSWNCGIYRLPGEGDADVELARALGSAGRSLGDRPVRSYAARLVEPGGSLGRDAALLAGEELGVEALAGEGISLALWTGAIAGQSTARALLAGRSPRVAHYQRALWAAPPWRSRLLMDAIAERLYGSESSRYRELALGSPRTASLLTDLITGRRSLGGVLLGLAGVYGYHRAFGLLREAR
jgi:flavin-dependent dehydrogenase